LPQEAKQEAVMITLSESAKPIDDIFRALSDPTRRHVLERLSKSPASVSDLAEPFDMALPSFVQHMGILEDCGLVQSHKAGRVRTYQLAPQRLKLAENWLARQRTIWDKRLDQLDTYLVSLREKQE
jgi:DNA-binding transcriptional ArsR family regulator